MVSAQSITYRWVARVRPDTSITSKQYGAVAKKVTAATLDTARTEGRVWFRSGGGSDCFAVMTRAALDGYRTIWEEVSLPKRALLLSPCGFVTRQSTV